MTNMKKIILIIFVGLLSVLIICGFTDIKSNDNIKINVSDITINFTNISQEKIIINDSIINDVLYPKPTYIPALRQYEIDKSHDIWHAKDPSSYITPDNEWVKYYASQLFVDYDGVVKYKGKIPAIRKNNGEIVVWQYELFVNDYITDNNQFNYPANADYWINADYYLTHKNKGDCEDFAITLTSLLLSGEVSIWKDDILVKQVILAKTVIGWTTYWNSKPIVDSWSEYRIYDIDFIGNSQGRNADSSFSITNYFKKEDVKNQFKPYFEFTNKYFRRIQ